nr:hypothetical protein [Candidatus Sigynarchaeota archaeon]
GQFGVDSLFSFHVSNLIIHMVCAWLVFIMLRKLTQNKYIAGFFAVLCSPFAFMGFIAFTKEFSKAINLKMARLFLFLSAVPIIALIIVGTSSPVFYSTIAFTALNAIIVIQFQIKMIKLSLGKMRNRLAMTLTGELLALASLGFALLVIVSYQIGIRPEVFFFIATTMLTTGFLVMFWAANDFPPFYEFDYKLNLEKLFVISEKDQSIIYEHDFSHEKEEGRDEARDQLFSGAITGIEEMLSAVTEGSGHEGKKRLSKIDQKGSFIFLEYGDHGGLPLIYALVVKKDFSSMSALLKTVRLQFEGYFNEILAHYDELKHKANTTELFNGFDIFIQTLTSS